MPRLGKGKGMADQARAVLKKHLDLSSRHEAKQSQSIKGSKSTGKIHSVRTFNKYCESLKGAGEWMKKTHSIRFLNEAGPAMAKQYLEHRRDMGISQKQLDTDRVAMQYFFNQHQIEKVHSRASPDKSSRRYTQEQVYLITQVQAEQNALSTTIAKETGIRAHELLTIRKTSELRPSSHRNWHKDRFLGREGERYMVTGKGGLKREMMLTKETAQKLEQCRLAEPRLVIDRGVHYQQYYNITGGNTWSKSFSDASSRILGWSHGAHGLRHTYAQDRMLELQNLGIRYQEARDIVSQELGHFRGDVVETYLR